MAPLNPFLRAFFRSALPSQCSPINHHILLVPTTDVLLNAKDQESNTSFAELAATEDFLASHVLRVPGGTAPGGTGKDGGGAGASIRETKAKAKQYPTINGRTVVVKESFVYSNKGFRTLNQAQLLYDAIYYPLEATDGQQWLIYYISRPLLGTYEAMHVPSALISDEPSRERRTLLTEASASGAGSDSSSSGAGKKKEVKNFGDLLNQYPMISRQMQAGLEKTIRDFVAANEAPPVAKRPSRRSSVSSQHSARSLSESVSSIKSSLSGDSSAVHPTAIRLEPEEEVLRTSLERTINNAIDLFQSVDKQQLSLLGTNTELTGPAVERMIERYVVEQVHDQTLFPRVCATRSPDDSDLDSKIRKMADVDIAQVGIPLEGGMMGKRALAVRLAKGVEAFKKIGVSSSPLEMLEILLAANKAITAAEEVGGDSVAEDEDRADPEKQVSPMTINADVLVSMLLIVVIRSGVRHLHSRLLYMRYFIFADEVDCGEQGYALATLEAVLAHLSSSSSTLRKASRQNRLLWQAASSGDLQTLEALLQPEFALEDTDTLAEDLGDGSGTSEDERSEGLPSRVDGESKARTLQSDDRRSAPMVNFAAVNGSLGHVFPFQKPPTPPPEQVEMLGGKAKKRVSLASLPRSQSESSGYSSRSHSRHMSVDSSLVEGPGSDLSSDKLAQTQDADGNSVLMMSIEARQHRALKFLLSLPVHFRADFVLQDVNNDNTTLLSAAVQSGNRAVTDELLRFLDDNADDDMLRQYLEVQDTKGRCAAHYLFNQPHLIQRFGKKMPWRLKDKNGQTPLFALCRSYDHEEYHEMVDTAMTLAAETQGDSARLHLDDHVDAKGNTLLHVVHDTQLTLILLKYCHADINAQNDKRFTPLMVGSKYGLISLVRVLFGDARVDLTVKDLRGLTAVELAKDDDMRNRIDDLVLLTTPPRQNGRTTTVVRSFFVEDATIRLVMKSGVKNANGTVTVTTCRRSVADFENLARWLNIECPASWLPTHFNLPSPFLIPSKPSRAVLRDLQLRLDNFFGNLLAHGTFRTHELVWEFFLVPELDIAMLEERSKRKAAARLENLMDDYEPVSITETAEVESFVQFAREQVRSVTQATKKTMHCANRYRMRTNDFADANQLAVAKVDKLLFLPPKYIKAFERYVKTLAASEASPWSGLYYALHSIQSMSTAIQIALNRPTYLIGNMAQAQRGIERSVAALTRGNRWTPNIGLFEDSKRSAAREASEKVDKARRELESLGCELRYTQQTVASELAVWQDEHVRSTRTMLRRFARENVVREKARLESMKRALREIQKTR